MIYCISVVAELFSGSGSGGVRYVSGSGFILYERQWDAYYTASGIVECALLYY